MSSKNGNSSGRDDHLRDAARILTCREKQVIQLKYFEYLTTKSIARKLKLSSKTVGRHKANVKAKFHAESSEELARMIYDAERLGILDLSDVRSSAQLTV